MRRATVSIPDELEEAVDLYRRDLEFSPSLAALMQAALREYLDKRGYAQEGRGAAARPSVYDGAPSARGGKTAAEMVLEDRR